MKFTYYTTMLTSDGHRTPRYVGPELEQAIKTAAARPNISRVYKIESKPNSGLADAIYYGTAEIIEWN